MAKQRYYELIVYFCMGNCAYSVCEKRFKSFERMIRYCKDFDAETNELLFDVWDSEEGQYNINNLVKEW